MGSAGRRHLVRRRLVGHLRGAQHPGHGHHVLRRGHRHHLVAVEHVRVYPRQLPDPDALAGHRLDRRYRPPRRLGRCPDRRAAIRRARAAELHPVHHDSVRARPRHPARDLRQEPAPPRTRRAGPIELARPPGLRRHDVPAAITGGRSRRHSTGPASPGGVGKSKESR